MNGISLVLALALIIGIVQFNAANNPLALTFLGIILVIHITNHTWVAHPPAKKAH